MAKYKWYSCDSKGLPVLGPIESDNLPDNKMIAQITEMKMQMNCRGCNKSWQEWVKAGCPFVNEIKEGAVIFYALRTDDKHETY